MLDASTVKYDLTSIVLLFESCISPDTVDGRDTTGCSEVGRLCKRSLNVNESIATKTLPWYNTINCLTLPGVDGPGGNIASVR